MDCVTEAPSWANISENSSSSFVDTRSEPAAYYGKDVDRIMKRAIQQQAADPPSTQQLQQQPSSSSSTTTSSVTKPMSLSAKISGDKSTLFKQQQQKQQQPTATSKGNNYERSSQVSTATSSGGRSKKSKKSTVGKTLPKNTTTTTSVVSVSSSSNKQTPGRSNTSSSAMGGGGSIKSSHQGGGNSIKSQTTHRSKKSSNSTINYHPGQTLAISSPPTSNKHQLDPPPASPSTYVDTSSNSTSCGGGDPPSVCSSVGSRGEISLGSNSHYTRNSSTSSRTGGNISRRSRRSNASSSQRSSRKSPSKSSSTIRSRRTNQEPEEEQILQVWNEVDDEDLLDEESQYIAQEHRSIESVGEDEDDNDEQNECVPYDPEEEGYSRTSSSNESSESYYSNEEGEDDNDDDDSATRVSELCSAVGRALAIRNKEEEEEKYNRSDSNNARAIVTSDDYGGVNSYYESGGIISTSSQTLPTTTSDQQQIINKSVSGNNSSTPYLSKAIDNYNGISMGMVPINSTIYEAYDHTFVTCPESLRFKFLYTFLKKNLDKKIMIFFSTTNSAKFHSKLLNHFHITTLLMHGKMRREKFINQFFKFSDLDEGILCATDVAGRDLDIPPSVDWVIQYEPPEDPSEYILRVARISCDSDRVGRSLLFLNCGEKSGFLKYYSSASIPVSEFEIPVDRLADVQSHIEHHVNENEKLLRYARDAYGSYLIAYASHGFRDVYNVHDLNKGDVSMAFGLVGSGNGGEYGYNDDDNTAETDTLATFSCVGENGLGYDKLDKREGTRKTWKKKEKTETKSKSWMKGEKTWPHSQIKVHPKFKGGGGSSSHHGHHSQDGSY